MTKTLYERLGGEDAIAAVVDEFYDRVMADGQVAGYFDDVDMQKQRAHQAQFISSVTGGPVEYAGGEMKAVHAEMGITPSDFQAIATHLDDALVSSMSAMTTVRRSSRKSRATRVRSSRPRTEPARRIGPRRRDATRFVCLD